MNKTVTIFLVVILLVPLIGGYSNTQNVAAVSNVPDTILKDLKVGILSASKTQEQVSTDIERTNEKTLSKPNNATNPNGTSTAGSNTTNTTQLKILDPSSTPQIGSTQAGIKFCVTTSNPCYGTDGKNTMRGDDGPNLMYGMKGDDLMSGNGAGDEIYGDEGNDRINGDAGNDRLIGNTGNDRMDGGAGDDYMQGDAPNAPIGGDDIMYGGDGNDILLGYSGADSIAGGDGDDKIYHSNDGIAEPPPGSTGEGLTNPDGSKDTIDCGPGNDEIWINVGTDKDTAINCEQVHRDPIKPRGGQVTPDLTGIDEVDPTVASGQQVTANQNVSDGKEQENDTKAIEAATQNIVPNPNVIKCPSTSNPCNGTNVDDRMVGDDGDNIIIGFEGNDSITGKGGNDSLYGGAGDDIMWGMDGDDRLSGYDGNNRLYGGFGNDLLYTLYAGYGVGIFEGGYGDDWIYGGTGDDQMQGGPGADRIYGGPGNDIIWHGYGGSTNASDGFKDIIDCGEGLDQVWINSNIDGDEVHNCETVNGVYLGGDSDNDYVPDDIDNCPGVSNNSQKDSDFDGLGDPCDPFPFNSNLRNSTVTVRFLDITIHNKNEGITRGSGEWDLAAYVQGKLIKLSELSGNMVCGSTSGTEPCFPLWFAQNGQIYHFDKDKAVITVEIPEKLKLLIFTAGSEIDDCGRVNFPDISKWENPSINDLLSDPAKVTSLQKNIHTNFASGCVGNDPTWPSSPNDMLDLGNELHDLTSGLTYHMIKNSDFTLRYTINVVSANVVRP